MKDLDNPHKLGYLGGLILGELSMMKYLAISCFLVVGLVSARADESKNPPAPEPNPQVENARTVEETPPKRLARKYCFVVTCSLSSGLGDAHMVIVTADTEPEARGKAIRDVLPKFPGCVEEEISLILVPCSIIEEMELPVSYSLHEAVTGFCEGDCSGVICLEGKPFRLHVPVKGKDECEVRSRCSKVLKKVGCHFHGISDCRCCVTCHTFN